MQDHIRSCCTNNSQCLVHRGRPSAVQQPGRHGAGAAGIAEGTAHQQRAVLAQALDGLGRLQALCRCGCGQVEDGQGMVSAALWINRQFGTQIDHRIERTQLRWRRNSPQPYVIHNPVRLRMLARPQPRIEPRRREIRRIQPACCRAEAAIGAFLKACGAQQPVVERHQQHRDGRPQQP